MNYSLNIVTTTIGRSTLPRLIETFYACLNENDYYTIISEENHEYVRDTIGSFDFKCNLIHIEDNSPGRNYGHPLINRYKHKFKGDFIMFADDDDRYAPNAIDTIKKHWSDKECMYIYRHKWGQSISWTIKDYFEPGNIGKCIVSIPNIPEKIPNIVENVLGDGLWFKEMSSIFKWKFIDEIIYLVRDSEL